VAITAPLCGCQTSIETNLSARDADALIEALHGHHLSATKRAQASVNGEQMFAVFALNAELADAISILRATPTPTTGQSSNNLIHEPGWIPTPTDEQIHLADATAARLEETIRLWDGVVAARVHITPNRLSSRPLGSPASPPTAAVVITHRRGRAPTQDGIQQLVAHAVDQLRPEDVAVITLEAPAATLLPLTQVGPIAVTVGSARALRLGLIAALGAIATFVTLVALAWRRVHRESTSS
jgi:type III secretory pathway lipoprotein EscJ